MSSAAPSTPTPNCTGRRAAAKACFSWRATAAAGIRRRQEPTAIGRTPPAGLARASRRAWERKPATSAGIAWPAGRYVPRARSAHQANIASIPGALWRWTACRCSKRQPSAPCAEKRGRRRTVSSKPGRRSSNGASPAGSAKSPGQMGPASPGGSGGCRPRRRSSVARVAGACALGSSARSARESSPSATSWRTRASSATARRAAASSSRAAAAAAGCGRRLPRRAASAIQPRRSSRRGAQSPASRRRRRDRREASARFRPPRPPPRRGRRPSPMSGSNTRSFSRRRQVRRRFTSWNARAAMAANCRS